MILAIVDGIFCNCAEKPAKVGTSTEFEPVTSRFRCDALNQLSYIWFVSYIISTLIHSSREHGNPHMTTSQRQWLHNPHDTHAVAIKRMEGKRKRKQIIVGHVPLTLYEFIFETWTADLHSTYRKTQ